MKISARTEYACLALMRLAASYGGGEPVPIRSIAEAHNISQRFLVQILLQLKGGGLVVSTRGATGGYQLARSPEEITLGEVVALVEGQEADPSGSPSDPPAIRVLRDIWRQARDAQQHVLDSITLDDLLQRLGGETERMYYI